jgi:hypothetical protein
MSEEVELAAKSVGAVVGALADDTGALGPVRRFSEYLTARVGFHYAPKMAERAMAAAKVVEQSGLPRRAYSEISDCSPQERVGWTSSAPQRDRPRRPLPSVGG